MTVKNTNGKKKALHYCYICGYGEYFNIKKINFSYISLTFPCVIAWIETHHKIVREIL